MAKKQPIISRVGWSAMEITRLRSELWKAKKEIRDANARILDLTLRNQDLETRLARAYRTGEAKKVRLAPRGADRVGAGSAALERDPSRGA